MKHPRDPYAPLWCLTWLATPALYLCGFLRREDAEAKARAEGWEVCMQVTHVDAASHAE